MTNPSLGRPRDLTLALVFIVAGSVLSLLWFSGRLVLVGAPGFGVGSIGSSGDVSAGDAGMSLRATRIVLSVLVVASLAGIVMATLVWRRHRGSRVPLTILAGLAAMFYLLVPVVRPLSFLWSIVLVLCLVVIWSPATRRWFQDGRLVPAHRLGRTRESTARVDPRGSTRSEPAASWAPRPGASPGKRDRPGVVIGASVTAGVSSALALLVGVVLMAEGLFLRGLVADSVRTDPDLRRQLATSDLTIEQVQDVSFVVGAVITVLAVLGILASVAYARRWSGGLAFLGVMSVLAIASAVTVVGLLVAAPAVVVLVLVLREDSRLWSASR